jgi:nucleotide-binding universal stress UspA family protein
MLIPPATAISGATPLDEIIALMNAKRADLIMIGTHARRSVARALRGSAAETNVTTASCPVLTAGAKGVAP